MHTFVKPNMEAPREFAAEAARRILMAGNIETPLARDSQLFMDLAEMIRQRMTGEKLLEENSRWFIFPACGTELDHPFAHRPLILGKYLS